MTPNQLRGYSQMVGLEWSIGEDAGVTVCDQPRLRKRVQINKTHVKSQGITLGFDLSAFLMQEANNRIF
jgi:hypothetical protein